MFLLFMQIFKGLLNAYFFPETYVSSEEINLQLEVEKRSGGGFWKLHVGFGTYE